MKKVSLFLSFLMMLAFSASANVLLTEEFNYEPGTALGSAEGWTTTGTLTTGTGRIILATPLTYSNAGGEYILSGIGKSVKNNYTEGDNYFAYKHFTKASSGVIYVSYMYQADGNQGQSNSEIIGISNGTTNSSLKAWAGKQSDGTSNPFRLGVTRASTAAADVQWCDTKTVDIDNVVLIVLKYDFSTQIASLFINPTIGTTEEPTADIIDNDKGTAKSSMEYLMFKHNGKNKANFVVGGVRVCTTWEEAVQAKGEIPTDITLERINTDFNDGTWGDITPNIKESLPASGEYGNRTINGFELNAAYMLGGSIKYENTTYYNRIAVDKESKNGMVTFPAVREAQKIITYVSPGDNDRNITLQMWNYIQLQWEDVETYNCAVKGTCYRFETDLNKNDATKLRLVNNAGGAMYIWKIQTCPMPPTVERESIDFTFGDDVWSDLGTSSTTATVNEVAFTKCSRQTGTYYTPSSVKLTGRITLDKKENNQAGMMELPAVASASRVDIYANAGSEKRKATLQQYNYGLLEWEHVDTLYFETTDSYRFSVTLNSATATRLRIVNADGSSKYIIRVVTYPYPTAPTNLAVPEALAAENVAAHSFTAHWNVVENASGYRIVVFKEDGKRQTTKEVEGGDVFQYNIANLDPATNYTYKVAAIGDGENTIDSYLSEAIAVTTTAEMTAMYTRPVTSGYYGTICLPKASTDLSAAGATFFKVSGKVMDGSNNLKEVVLDEVIELEAGKPYVFLASADELNIPLTGEAAAKADTVNGLAGSFKVASVSSSGNCYILKDNKLYCAKNQTYFVGENRASFKIDVMSEFNGSAPAPGRRRVIMQTEESQTATGIDNAQNDGAQCTKVIRNGQIYIIRNGEYYDLTGKKF